MGQTITVNGAPRQWRDQTMRELLAELGVATEKGGVAVAVNAAVVPRADWDRRAIAPDDRVEVVQIVRGG